MRRRLTRNDRNDSAEERAILESPLRFSSVIARSAATWQFVTPQGTFLNGIGAFGQHKPRGGAAMKKEEEKKPIPWEMVDPKPPVIRSGHMENRTVNKEIM